MDRRIIRNSARCARCGDEVESRDRGNHVTCSCGALFIDGGHEYLWRGAMMDTEIEDTSIVEASEIITD